jgi:hypothetical protein
MEFLVKFEISKGIFIGVGGRQAAAIVYETHLVG